MEDTDIISEPAYREETIIDADFSYPSGLCQFTLHIEEGDRMASLDTGVTVLHFAARQQSLEEDTVLYPTHLEWTSTRKRVIKWPVKKPVTVKPEPMPSGS